MRFLKRWVMRLIVSYRKSDSLLIAKMSVQCIYRPTCSKYMLKSIHRFGLWKGGLLGTKRICRCNSSKFDGGEDPVPTFLSK